MRWLLLLTAVTLVAGCQTKPNGTTVASSVPPAVKSAATIRFTEISHQAGIDFVHTNGASKRKLMPETVGSGLALADFDGDGRLDLLIVNSRYWQNEKRQSLPPQLYQNLGDGKFRNVTAGSGLDKPLYGMGVAVADYDGDGKEDIYLTAVGPNRLYRNDGNFHFTDVTQAAGVPGAATEGIPLTWKWSTGASWIDYDRDGDLDLFVCQYVKWSPEIDPYCGHNGVRGYCPPDNFEGARCTLYHNDGNGHFTDVSKAVGLFDGAVGKSFGIGVVDANQDGWPDLVITNDTWANFLFINHAGKSFTEEGVPSGIGFVENGHARAGMGIDVGDWKNNGKFGIVIGNFVNEGLSLFEPEEASLYADHAQEVGISAPTLLNVTFATFFFDADLDGWPDLFVTNGHVDDSVNSYQSMLTFKQKPTLLHNEQGKRFTDVSATSGFTDALVGRGAAYGDIDGDGKPDIAILDNGGRFRLYHNDSQNTGNWLRLQLIGTKHNKDAIGALVKVTAGGITRSQYVKSGTGFLSESERTLTFGLGNATTADKVAILWPDGTETVSGPLPAGQTHQLKEENG